MVPLRDLSRPVRGSNPASSILFYSSQMVEYKGQLHFFSPFLLQQFCELFRERGEEGEEGTLIKLNLMKGRKKEKITMDKKEELTEPKNGSNLLPPEGFFRPGEEKKGKDRECCSWPKENKLWPTFPVSSASSLSLSLSGSETTMS